MFNVIIGVVIALSFGVMYLALKKKTDNTQPKQQIKGNRSELINYIVNKSLDSYEESLTKQLQNASDGDLKRTVNILKETEQLMYDKRQLH